MDTPRIADPGRDPEEVSRHDRGYGNERGPSFGRNRQNCALKSRFIERFVGGTLKPEGVGRRSQLPCVALF